MTAYKVFISTFHGASLILHHYVRICDGCLLFRKVKLSFSIMGSYCTTASMLLSANNLCLNRMFSHSCIMNSSSCQICQFWHVTCVRMWRDLRLWESNFLRFYQVELWKRNFLVRYLYCILQWQFPWWVVDAHSLSRPFQNSKFEPESRYLPWLCIGRVHRPLKRNIAISSCLLIEFATVLRAST